MCLVTEAAPWTHVTVGRGGVAPGLPTSTLTPLDSSGRVRVQIRGATREEREVGETPSGTRSPVTVPRDLC